MTDDCLFCRIARGEIPCHKVYEDDQFLAFLDIQPFNPGHVLLIPKNHYRWTYDIPNFGIFMEVGQRIALRQNEVINPLFVSFLTMGMLIPHAHLHIIPRFKDDPHKEGIDTTARLKPTADELSAIALQLKL